MELRTFLNSPITQAATADLIRNVQPADLGYLGATYFPEVVQNTQHYVRKVTVLSAAMIASDVAPLSTGVQKGGMQKYSIGGGLIDSAAHMHFDGEDIEMLIALVAELPGERVALTAPELATYLNLIENQLLTPLLMNRERKRMYLLGNGKVYPDGARDDDFTKPPVYASYAPGQITTVTTASGRSVFGGADADFIRDVREQTQELLPTGVQVREILMNSITLNAILQLPSTRRDLGLLQLDVSTGGALAVNMTQGAATAEQLNAKLASLQLPTISVYDAMWYDQVRAEGDPAGPVGTVVASKYVPDGRVIYIPRPNVLGQMVVNPTVPFRMGLFDPTNALGVHIIGRPTGQSSAGVQVFGPNFNEGVNPNMDGDSIMSHMPFNNSPYAMRVTNYQTA